MHYFRWPSLHRPLDVLFLLTCAVLTAYVLVPEIFLNGTHKDYELWYQVGRKVLDGMPLYDAGPGGLDFIYPPLPAVLLAFPSYFGKVALYLTLCLLNIAAWWITGQISNAMAGSDRPPGPWLEALPAFATLSSVYDMFSLGQPNLLLLAFMLIGFWWMQHDKPWLSGAMFALATAIKAYPIAVLPYLIFRRRWREAASMTAVLAILLVIVPAPIRGYERNLSELKLWFTAMAGSASAKGFGQRDTQNWSWNNQSLIAQTHRYVRHINYNQVDPNARPGYVNFIDVSFETANLIVLAVAGLIGLGFMWVVPARSAMTRRSTAEELGILFCLMTIASPLARQYYFLWLFFPLTVLFQRAAFDPRPAVRRMTWGALALVGVLMLLSLPIFPLVFQALGNNFAATAILAVVLGWYIRNPADQPSKATVPTMM